ncbi:hypothetical protein L840_5068 [Mycobacterium sp. MAC_011194_8550]|nr:hypothetical protein L840_5068 [Mycobacterium sp. MAC_011194_8550]
MSCLLGNGVSSHTEVAPTVLPGRRADPIIVLVMPSPAFPGSLR